MLRPSETPQGGDSGDYRGNSFIIAAAAPRVPITLSTHAMEAIRYMDKVW